jgi:hypothetical protein
MLGALVLTACAPAGGGRPAAPVSSGTPSPSPSVAVNPGTLSAVVHVGASTGIFIGGDDHVSIVIQNTGRDIGRLGIAMGLFDQWLDHHTVAMGSAQRCRVETAIKGFDCGPVRSGDETAIVLRATPDDAGTFKYGLRLYDLSGAVEPVTKPDGGDLILTFEETVAPLKT